MFLQETFSLQDICCNSDEKLFCVNSLSINLSDQREVILIYKQISTSSWFRLRKPVYLMLHLNFVMKRKHKSIKTETWIYLLFSFSASPETKQNKMDIWWSNFFCIFYIQYWNIWDWITEHGVCGYSIKIRNNTPGLLDSEFYFV